MKGNNEILILFGVFSINITAYPQNTTNISYTTSGLKQTFSNKTDLFYQTRISFGKDVHGYVCPVLLF